VSKSEKILKRLESLHPKQIDLSLNRIKVLLKRLGNPEKKLPPTIHVAGTNGKGSTLAFLRSIFEENNYKVHVYTSPHLINFNERIRLNSKIITNDFLIELLEECEFYNKNEPITFFEITTAAAYLAFSKIPSDVLLLETGLGGKYDATNIIRTSMCSVLTPISMDHMNFLGNSIKSITKEKVGIFKKNVPAVISKQNIESFEIINKESKKKNVKLYAYNKFWKISKINPTNFNIKVGSEHFCIPIPKLFGHHQLYNSGTALTVSKVQNILKLNDGLTFSGIKKTFWPARMQNLKSGKLKKIIGKNFELWLDGGHNKHASDMLKYNLENWKKSKLFLIFGMLSNKEPKEFLGEIIKYFTNLYVLPIHGHDYIKSNDLKNIYIDSKQKIISKTKVEYALEDIKNKCSKGKIIICGSLYLAGEILKKNGTKII